MSKELEQKFRRLLHAYPKQWRERHGEAFLGTLLDEAEAEGRTRPTVSMRLSLIMHGFAERISFKAIIGMSMTSLTLSVLGMVFQLTESVPSFLPGWLGFALTIGLSAWLTIVASSGLLRVLGYQEHWRSLLVSALALPALVLTLFAAMSWGQGFEEADAGVELSGFASAFGPLFIAAFVFGALSSAIFLDGLVANPNRNQGVRKVVAIVGGAILALAIGLFVISPFSTSAAAAIAMATAIWAKSRAERQAHPPTGSRHEQRTEPQWPVLPSTQPANGVPVLVRVLAGISAFLGAGAIAFALSGSTWPGIGMDSTRVLQLGMAAAALAGVPLVVAFSRWWNRPGGTYDLPMLFLALALVVFAVGTLFGDGSGSWVSMIHIGISMVLSSVAVGCGSSVLLNRRNARLAGSNVSIAIGIGFAFTLAFIWVNSMSFVLPVVAVIVLVWRNPRKAPEALYAGVT